MTRRAAALTGLVVLAILLRIGAIAYTRATSAPAEENRIIAGNLVAGHGFTFTELGVTGPTAIRGPVYPMLLAILGPDRVTLALAVNVIAGAASVVAAYSLTRRLGSPLPGTHGGGLGRGSAELSEDLHPTEDPLPNPPPAYREREQRGPWLAAALFTVWPTQLYAATLTQGLSIAVLLTLAALALAFRRTPAAALAGGVLAGLAALTEPVLALPLLLVTIDSAGAGWHGLVIQAVSSDLRKTRLGLPNRATRNGLSSALFIAAGCVVVAPWLYRNAIVFGGPMPITSNFWRDMFAANGPEPTAGLNRAATQTRGDWVVLKPRLERLSPADFDRLKRPEPERIAVFRGWTTDQLRQRPAPYLARCVDRIGVILFGHYEHPLAARASFWFYSTLTFFAAWIILPRFASDLRTAVLLVFGGLAIPMILVAADARMIPLLDLPLLLACAGGFFSNPPFARESA